MNIEFHILQCNQQAGLLFVCQLTEQLYQAEKKVWIETPSPQIAKQLDELLWTFRDDSFIPHALHSKIKSATPVRIGFSEYIPQAKDLQHVSCLINFATAIPAFYQQFSAFSEIVFNEASIRDAARLRYKTYQTQGHQLITHKI